MLSSSTNVLNIIRDFESRLIETERREQADFAGSGTVSGAWTFAAGAKFGDGVNYAQFDSNGILSLHGTARNWEIFDLAFDFTGTEYDTRAKCQALGLRFSDDDTPFPTQLRAALSGSWSHSAGNGWRPATTVDAEGPGILIPLARGNNFEFTVTVKTYTRSPGDNTYLYLGAVGPGLHVPFFTINLSYSSQYYCCYGQYNNGDDTFTVFYSGSSDGVGTHQMGIRIINGVIGVLDGGTGTWQYYTEQFGGYMNYPLEYVFIQAYNRPGYTYHTLDVRNLALTYFA